jgi:hypothetical protein
LIDAYYVPRSEVLVLIQLVCKNMCGEICVLDGVAWF